MLRIFQSPTTEPGRVVLRGLPETWIEWISLVDIRFQAEREARDKVAQRRSGSHNVESVECTPEEAAAIMDVARKKK
jgi:hypothetical protein